jgi:hypothetical protein
MQPGPIPATPWRDAAYAIHLATAVAFGADKFITNNRRDFSRDQIVEIDVTYPDML